MLIISGARVIDPARRIDGIRDIYIEGGVFAERGEAGAQTFDARGLIAAPGLVDMHVHFRDPGQTHKEDIISGAMSAAAGGVTTAVCMPNTSPVIDTPELVRYVLDAAEKAAVRVLPFGAVSIGQAGEALTDFEALCAAGAVALSDDGNPLMSAGLMRQALTRARELGMIVSTHCEDAGMVQNRAVNEGRVSRVLRLRGRPAIAEEIMVARDAMLASETGAGIHIAHVSTARSVEIIRRAKNEGAKITAETCPQYFSLTEDEILSQGALARVNPPLRTEADVLGIIEGLRDGTLDVIATDHAPHALSDKEPPLEKAMSGMVGLETSLALALTRLYHSGTMPLTDILRKLSLNPAEILGLELGTFAPDRSADLVLFDLEEIWTVEPDKFKSKSRNTPFAGQTLRGRVKYTISRGNIVYRGE